MRTDRCCCICAANEGRRGAEQPRQAAHRPSGKKCKSDLKALYAGYIEDAYRRVMFFYTDKASRIEALDDMADRERYLYCSAGASDDPEWNTYLNLLYPDAAKYYTETNRKTPSSTAKTATV